MILVLEYQALGTKNKKPWVITKSPSTLRYGGKVKFGTLPTTLVLK